MRCSPLTIIAASPSLAGHRVSVSRLHIGEYIGAAEMINVPGLEAV